MKYSSRFFLWAPLAVFILLLAIAGIHWWILASRLGGWLDAHNGREIMPGVTMQFASRRITGFPFSLDTEFRDVRLAVATPRGATSWQSEHFAMHGLTYGRDETIFEAAGHQTLSWTRADGSVRRLDFAVASLRASAIDKAGALQRFDLDLVGFGSKAFTAQRLQFHARRDKGEILFFDEANGLLTKRTCIKDSHLRYEGALTSADAFDLLLSGRVSIEAGLRAWRDKGGVVKPAQASPLSVVPVEELPGITALTHAICR